MMKSLLLKSLIATCVTGISILLTSKASVGQINTEFLKEVAESCQKDIFSSEYYKSMEVHYSLPEIKQRSGSGSYYKQCIRARYFYLLVISKFPWLVSTEDIIPGFPGSVAVSRIAQKNRWNKMNILDCIASKNEDSRECTNDSFDRTINGTIYYFDKFDSFGSGSGNIPTIELGYTCPSCVVAYNNNPSNRKMIGKFIEWFTKLEPSQRKELMSILGEGAANRNSMGEEAHKAWAEYTATRRRIAEEEKQRKRRELFE